MNVLLLVVDSLRKRSLDLGSGDRPQIPFLDAFAKSSLYFSRAYATECWTLPTHMSMFTGLLPSEHNAHFATMAYDQRAPTIAELFSEAGHHTEIFTRNTIFDGRLAGVTRGFQHNTLTQVEMRAWSLAAWFVALTKPRLRRQVNNLGFFNTEQKESLEFLRSYARSIFPADHVLCEQVIDRLSELQNASIPHFLFCNLYDCHAPYPPDPHNIVQPIRSVDDLLENIFAFQALPQISSHAYLREGFQLPARGRSALLRRYHRSIELMDGKLAAFFDEADGRGLLDDTVVIVTSDHGEAFGEHDLYLHDASVYDVHLSVPMWIRWPGGPTGECDDVVSTRDLFGLMQGALAGSPKATILEPDSRQQAPHAVAEHFHYPRFRDIAERYRQNIVSVRSSDRKLIVHRDGATSYDLRSDPLEKDGIRSSLNAFADEELADGRPIPHSVLEHLERWDPTR